MDAYQIWDFLPETIETLERSYNLFKTVVADFREYVRGRQKNNMKNSILEIRGHVGEIDATFSKLRAKMQIAEARNDTSWFEKYQNEMRTIYSRVVDSGNELMISLGECGRYLDGYPKLRDALHLKLESEHVIECENEEICGDLWRFTWWVNVAGDLTRRSLELLNEHIESEYESN